MDAPYVPEGYSVKQKLMTRNIIFLYLSTSIFKVFVRLCDVASDKWHLVDKLTMTGKRGVSDKLSDFIKFLTKSLNSN